MTGIIKIRTFMMKLLLINLFIFIAIFGIFIYVAVLNNTLSFNKKQISEFTDYNAEKIGGHIKDISESLKSFSEMEDIKSFDWNRMYPVFSMYIKRNFETYRILFADEKGISINTHNEIANISDRDYYKEIMENDLYNYLSEPIISRTTNQPIFVISQKISSGKRKGIIAAVIDINVFSNYINNNKADNYGFIINSEGKILINPVSVSKADINNDL